MTERINISMPEELASQIREAGLPVSRICQNALRIALSKWNGMATDTPNDRAWRRDPVHLYRRVSLELASSWPGEVYLRFEPFDDGPAVMVRVMPGDIVSISLLADGGNTEVVTPIQVEPLPEV